MKELKDKLLSIYSENFDSFYTKAEKILSTYKKKTNNILVVQLNGMGDLILASSALRNLRENYSLAHITLVTTREWISLVEYCPYVNKVIASEINNLNYKEEITSCISFCNKYLWEEPFDLAINLHYNICSFCGSVLCWLAVSNEIRGYSFDAERQYFSPDFNMGYFEDDLHMDRILTHPYINPPELIHEVDRKLYLLDKVTSPNLELFLTNKDIDTAFSLVSKKFIALGIGGSMKSKHYPPNKLVKALKQIDNNFVLLGGKKDEEDADYISRKIKCINLVGKLSIRETAAVISLSSLYIGNDTGLTHMAAAANEPIIEYICQAKDKNNVKPGSRSALARFRPYYGNNGDKAIILQPEESLQDCKKVEIYSGCCHEEAHCITQIDYRKIIEAYEYIKQHY